MAAGVPVVATAASGVHEIFQDGEDSIGIVVPVLWGAFLMMKMQESDSETVASTGPNLSPLKRWERNLSACHFREIEDVPKFVELIVAGDSS